MQQKTTRQSMPVKKKRVITEQTILSTHVLKKHGIMNNILDNAECHNR